MKKHENLLLLIILVLAILIVSLSYVYNKYYLSSAKTYATYLEIYQEYEKSEIKSFSINTINHKIIIKASTSDKIKIDYFQKADNSNTYHLENEKLTFSIIEGVEDIDTLLYKSERKINVITIYLPIDMEYSFTYSTVNGNIEVDGAAFSNLVLNNIQGDITLTNITTNNLNTSSNTGNVRVDNCEFKFIDVKAVAGSIEVSVNQALNDYNYYYETSYGTLLINGQSPVLINEDGTTKTLRKAQSQEETKDKKMELTTIRGQITVTTVEPEVIPEEEIVEE